MKVFWKIYFFLFLIVVIGVVQAMPSDKTTTTLTYIDLVISLPSIVVLYGWAWGKKILNKNIWRIYTPLFLISDFVYNIFFDKGNKASWGDALGGLVLLAPLYIATVLYTIKFDKIKA